VLVRSGPSAARTPVIIASSRFDALPFLAHASSGVTN
jgi:hypothetical protein